MERVEILAPAGSSESLYAAINKGADAVYLGGNKFSARAYASNFDNDNMIKAVDYAHYYGVKVYITLNTVLKENELDEAVKYVGFLYEIGVDALIIQDMGLFKRIVEQYPDFELHASTQLTVHNGEAALYFKEKGFSRIVLSREMNFDEIKYISSELAIETEMFVHGALCISYSGQCLMSSIIGGRSGNRGRCAQPCRMEYILKGQNSGEKKGYLLSPKDMCTIEDVEDIINTGTYSLKIEGRMKRAEYVAGVVDNYRKAVDSILLNKKYDNQKGKRQLLQLFNRSGFTKAFLKQDTGSDMMSYNSPKNSGVPLGKIDSNGYIVLQEDLKLGDGVRYGDKGFTLSKITLKNIEVAEAKRGEKVKLFPVDYKKGDSLFKSLNKELFNDLEQYLKPYSKKIPLSAKVTFKVGAPLTLNINYNNNNYEFFGEVVEKAEKRPLEKQRVEEALKKSSDIPFKIDNIEFEEFDEGFLRIADLNNLRRDALEFIAKNISKSYRRKRINREFKDDSVIQRENIGDIFSCITKEQVDTLINMGITNIALDLFSREYGALREKDLCNYYKDYDNKINFYIKTSTIVKGEFREVCNLINRNKPYIKGILTSNVGIIKVFKDQLSIIGDYKLNILNSESLRFYQKEIDLPTISLEVNKGEIKKISKKYKGNVAMMVYGKPELMISEYCPIGSTFGGKTSNSKCNVVCSRDKFTLIDRVNEKLRVMTDLYCRSYILNPVAINLLDEIDLIKEMGVSSLRFDFRDEDCNEVKKIIDIYINNKEFNKKDFTKGHFRRGVE